MSIKRTFVAVGTGIATAAALTAPVSGEVFLSPDSGHVRSNSGVALYNFGATVYENNDGETMDSGTDWSSTVGFSRDGGALFNATVSSHGAWAYNPTNTGLGGPISSVGVTGLATLDVTTNTQNTEEFVNAGFGHSLYVNFATDTQWTFSGVFDGMCASTGVGDLLYGWNMQVLDVNGPFGVPWPVAQFEHLESSSNTAFQNVVSEGGTLGAGEYIFVLNAFVGVEFIEQEGQFGSTTQSLQLTGGLLEFSEVPAPGAASLLGIGLVCASRGRRRAAQESSC